jgi:hypothetical protein
VHNGISIKLLWTFVSFVVQGLVFAIRHNQTATIYNLEFFYHLKGITCSTS